MHKRQRENLARALVNPNENWMRDKLEATRFRWRRQACWGFRIYDFWSHELGIAVEVDGDTHQADADARQDALDLARSGILVLRVPNRDEARAAEVLQLISESESWRERRDRLGIRKGEQRGGRSVDNAGAATFPEQEPLL